MVVFFVIVTKIPT